MPHKVRKHYWTNGILRFIDQLFNNVEEALDHANSTTDAHSVKVYNDNDQVIQEVTPTVSANTYA